VRIRDEGSPRVSISVGVATPENNPDLSIIMRMADEALYKPRTEVVTVFRVRRSCWLRWCLIQLSVAGLHSAPAARPLSLAIFARHVRRQGSAWAEATPGSRSSISHLFWTS
jgi:hypothetical protein